MGTSSAKACRWAERSAQGLGAGWVVKGALGSSRSGLTPIKVGDQSSGAKLTLV